MFLSEVSLPEMGIEQILKKCRAWEMWKNLSPLKVEIFVWMALQDRVATRSALLVMTQEYVIGGAVSFVPLLFFARWDTPAHVSTWSNSVEYLVNDPTMVADALGVPSLFGEVS